MTQLVELQEALPKFTQAGIKLYAVSYDDPEALKDFSNAHSLGFPLLSDPDSAVIRRYGILNTLIAPHQAPYYGVPFPGTYLVDESGIVTEKFFSRSLAIRESGEAIIDSALGEILLGGDEPQAGGGDDDVKITAAFHGGAGTLRGTARRELVVRFELGEGIHIYADPVPEGMVATHVEVSGPPGLIVEPAQLPPSHTMQLAGVDADLHVWSGSVDIVVPVWADSKITPLIEKASASNAIINVKVSYQACDDKACRLPKSEEFKLEVPIEPFVTFKGSGGLLRGQKRSSVDFQKHMRRLLWRGLRRHPLRSAAYMVKNFLAMQRGPAGKGRR